LLIEKSLGQGTQPRLFDESSLFGWCCFSMNIPHPLKRVDEMDAGLRLSQWEMEVHVLINKSDKAKAWASKINHC